MINPMIKKGIYEQRVVPYEELEFRIDDDNKKPKITGYAAMFNKRSQDLGGFVEQIAPGAFKKTIKDADVRTLLNHDPNYVLGRNKAGTLHLNEDERGLKIETDPPETQWANDLLISMRRGDIDQMSFGFRTIKDDWAEADKTIVRTLLEVQLFDVSVVTYPAYISTSANVRALLYTDEFAELAEVLNIVHRGESLDKDHLVIIEKGFAKLRTLFPGYEPEDNSTRKEPEDNSTREKKAAEDFGKSLFLLRKKLDSIEKTNLKGGVKT